MDLDELKLTRRTFLKFVGAAIAGVAVPGFDLQVQAPVVTHDFYLPPPRERFQFLTPSWIMKGGLLSVAMQVPHDAVGDGRLQLLWMGEADREFGWWADYLEMHVGRRGEIVSPKVVLPETIGVLETGGAGIVNRSDLGKMVLLPGEVLVMALWAPSAYSAWDFGETETQVLGLRLDYEA